ncbi:nuclear mitotic apparatus protein 1 isoform X2 [Heptranchias perlo]|uniref:nuclear mitotic apparatus protein 1 isoform X2 n=1 Tax=Heptranchias perlo TaxID=212740 RepID=UPI00355AB169
MALHRTKAVALVKWINSLKLSEEIENLTGLQDCVVFIKVVCRITGKENASQLIEEKSIEERLQFICNFLKYHCRYNPAAGSVVSWQKILHGEDVELEMAKVTVLLLHLHTMAKQNPWEFEALDIETQGELVHILHYVLDNEEGIHLDNNLATFLRSRASSPVTRLFSASSDETNSPTFCGKSGVQRTRFLASSVYSYAPSTSPTSPMRDFMQTPLVQMRRMKKQLADSRMLHDELEIELTEARKLITEKETQISIMQQKVDRLVKLTERQASEQEPDELGNLREKNESLLNRLRDAQKQCQDLKTEKSQMERKIDKLEEENGDLSYKVRDFGSRLAQSQKALNELADEHEAAVPLWEGKHKQLKNDLHVTLSEKKCLEEKIQILEGKVSLMEDQLKVAGESSSEMKGEVMGDILQLEAFKVEVSQLTTKAAELEQENAFHKEEKSQLTATVAGLQQSVRQMVDQKELLEQAARVQEERLTGQLDALNVEIMKLHNSLMQKDVELEEEKMLKHQLAEDLQSKERAAQQAALDLRGKSETLEEALRVKENALLSLEREMEAERESKLQQVAALKEEAERTCNEKASVVMQYESLKAEKEAELELLTKQIQALEDNQMGVEVLERERNKLALKVQELDTQVAGLASQNQSLQSACETHVEEVAALQMKLQETEGKLAGLDESLRNNEALQEQLASLQGTIGGLESERKRWEEARALEAERLLQMEQEVKGLMEERDQTRARLSEDLKRREVTEGQMKQSIDEQLERSAKLQSDLSDALAMVKEKEKEEERLREDVAFWKEKIEVGRQREVQRDQIVLGLKEEREKAQTELLEERAKRSGLEIRLSELNAEEQGKASVLQSELCDALSRMKEKEALEDKARAEVVCWQEKYEAAQKEASLRLSQVEEEARRASDERDRVRRELSDARAKAAELEERVKQSDSKQQDRISGLERDLSRALQVTREEEARVERSRLEASSLRTKLEELRGTKSEQLAEAEDELRKLLKEKDGAKAELEAERTSKAQVEAKMKQSLKEQQESLATLQDKVSSALSAVAEKEAKEKVMRDEADKWQEEAGRQQAKVSELQAEVSAAKGMKEKIVSQEREMLRYAELLSKREEELQELGCRSSAAEEAVRQHQQQVDRAERELSVSRSLCQEKLDAIEGLQSQVAGLELKCEGQQGTIAQLEAEKAEQGSYGREHLSALQADLVSARVSLNEKESSERALQEKVALHLEELEKQKDRVQALELEIPTWQRKSAQEQQENEKLREKMEATKEASRRLRETVEALKAEKACASSEALQRESAAEATRLENLSLKEEIEAQKLAAQSLQGELAAARQVGEKLEREVLADREKRSGEERELLRLSGDLAKALAELGPAKDRLEQQERLLAELSPLRERCLEQEREIQQLQGESRRSKEQERCLQQSNSQLAAALSSEAGLAQGRLEAELAKAREAHAEELGRLTARQAEQEAASKAREEDSRKRVEVVTSKYENEKRKVLDEQQKLITQVEQLQKKLAAENQKIADLNQKLVQHDTAAKSKLQKLKAHDSETQEKVERQQKQVAELTVQLEKKEEVVQHVKTQLEKAKTHYDGKKMLCLELTKKLEASVQGVSALEQQLAAARQESTDQCAESERLRKELQQAVREVKGVTQKNKALSAQVLRLEAQVASVDHQLRELNQSRPSTGATRPRDGVSESAARASETEADFSKDSMELSDLETTMAWENTGGRRGKAAFKTPLATHKGAGSLAAQKLRGNQESLESLYFTPLPLDAQSKLDTSLSSLGDLSLDSAKKTRSGRRRTTQVINILMTKKQEVEYEEASTSNSSFLSIQSSASRPSPSGRRSRGGRRNRPTSTTSLPAIDRSLSQDSLDGSNAEDLGAAALMTLPGYRPSTRRSTRLSTFGSLTSSLNTLYPGSCQDEPDQLDDWNRIAELQRRNGVCPPHMKTSYPLESNTASNVSIVTEEEVRLGDPKETLRRATLLPQQIKELNVTRQKASDSADPNWKGVTTRQRKRLSEETHQGSGTPEAKKQLICFPRPLTPKEKDKRGHSLFDSQAKRLAQNTAKNQADRRKSISYTVLNTPRKLGNTLLRSINKKATPRKTPKKSPRKSPKSNSKKDVGKRRFSRNIKM